MAEAGLTKLRFLLITVWLFHSILPTNQGLIDVRLVGGPTRYEGTLEVTDGVTWYTTCGSSIGFSDAAVVCSHLGFSGTNRGLDNSPFLNNQSTSVTLGCDSDDSNISSCTYSVQTSGCPSGSDVGAVVCYDESYLGCYDDAVFDRVLPDKPCTTSSSVCVYSDLTIDKCIYLCRNASYDLAGVELGEECFCGATGTEYSRLGILGDEQCNHRCKGNNQQSCGGQGFIAVFNLIPTSPSSSTNPMPEVTVSPHSTTPSTNTTPTNAPSTDTPSTNTTPTNAPATNTPSTDTTSTEAPSTDTPSTNSPTTVTTSTNTPSTVTTSTNTPSTDTPSTNTPSTATTFTEAPSTLPSTYAPPPHVSPTDVAPTDTPSTTGTETSRDVTSSMLVVYAAAGGGIGAFIILVIAVIIVIVCRRRRNSAKTTMKGDPGLEMGKKGAQPQYENNSIIKNIDYSYMNTGSGTATGPNHVYEDPDFHYAASGGALPVQESAFDGLYAMSGGAATVGESDLDGLYATSGGTAPMEGSDFGALYAKPNKSQREQENDADFGALYAKPNKPQSEPENDANFDALDLYAMPQKDNSHYDASQLYAMPHKNNAKGGDETVMVDNELYGGQGY